MILLKLKISRCRLQVIIFKDNLTSHERIVALCLEEQMIDEEIPHDHFDVKPDLIVTPSKVIKTDMFNEDIVLTNF